MSKQYKLYNHEAVLKLCTQQPLSLSHPGSLWRLRCVLFHYLIAKLKPKIQTDTREPGDSEDMAFSSLDKFINFIVKLIMAGQMASNWLRRGVGRGVRTRGGFG